MRVALNILSEDPGKKTGAYYFWLNLLDEFDKDAYRGTAFLIFFGKKSKDEIAKRRYKNLKFCFLPWSNENRIMRVFTEHLVLPFLCSLWKIDVLNSGIAPLLRIGSTKLVLHVKTMHSYTSPENIPLLTNIYRKIVYPFSMQRAEQIILNSISLQKELNAHLPKFTEKCSIVYEAVSHEKFFPNRKKGNSLNSLKPYILFLSTIYPYKNLYNLIKAIAGETTLGDFKLVVAGRIIDEPYMNRCITLAGHLGFSERLQVLGAIEDKDVATLYQNASVYAYPSLNETFGLTILEAMACGCPVVTSNCSAMPEIAGGSAVLVDPNCSNSIAKGIKTALDAREELIQLGLERSHGFRYSVTAKKTHIVYKKACTKSLNAGSSL